MSEAPALSRSRQWLLLAAAFTTFSVGSGFMHAYTVFLVTFIDVFGWSRAQVSEAYSTAMVKAASG